MSPDLSGTVLDGRYRLVSLLGVGGMGQVYEGAHISLERRVAIKILPSHLSEDPRFRARFAREARAAARITHRNVVQIMDFGGSPDGLVYFVMEFLDGQDLGALLRETGRLAWPRARKLLLQAVSALKAAHAHGIIHRDIKPGNCFLVDLPHEELIDVVKLLDFGIAKVLSELESHSGTLVKPLTGTGEIMGTASYMAPEQARCEPMDARSDVYSLGIMAYEMLTGRVPFVGVNPFHVVTKHLHDRPDPLRRAVPDIIPDVEDIVLRAIAKDPEDRFQSMTELEVAILAVTEESIDSAQTRVFSTTGPAAKEGDEHRSAPSIKPDNPTIVLREVDVEPVASEESFEDAETPSPLLLRHKFGEPYPLRSLPKDEPLEVASERAEEVGSMDAARLSESQRTTRVRIATPAPRSESVPVVVVDPAEAVMESGGVVLDVSEVDDTSASIVVPTVEHLEPSVVLPSGIAVDTQPIPLPRLQLDVESEAGRSKRTSARRTGWTSWPSLLGAMALLASVGGTIAALSLSEAREAQVLSTPTDTHVQAPVEAVPSSVSTDISKTERSNAESQPSTRKPTTMVKAPTPEGVRPVTTNDREQAVAAKAPLVDEPEAQDKKTTTAAKPENDLPGGTMASVSPSALPTKAPPKTPKPSRAQSEKCDYDQKRAQSSHEVGDYSKVIEHTALASCWPGSMRIKRIWLRQDALSNTKQYSECVAVGVGIKDAEIRKVADYCASKL